VSEAVIEARGLEKRFGPVPALRGLNLEVAAGSMLAVVGPNGAGKSTLLRLLAGLARPSAGELRVGSAATERRAARRQVGYVGHATLLYPALTARENLLFAARLYGVRQAPERVASLLEEHDLSALAEWRAGSLSQGQARRLSIARGLVHDPPVVLLDEPFAGLDRSAAGRLAERLAALRGGTRTTVLVTHDLARAAELADDVLILVRGRDVHRARRADLSAEALEHAYLAALEAAAA